MNKFGKLDFNALIKDDFLQIDRNRKTFVRTPIYRHCLRDHHIECILNFGQFLSEYEMGPKKVNELNGIGVQYYFDKSLHSTMIYEG